MDIIAHRELVQETSIGTPEQPDVRDAKELHRPALQAEPESDAYTIGGAACARDRTMTTECVYRDNNAHIGPACPALSRRSRAFPSRRPERSPPPIRSSGASTGKILASIGNLFLGNGDRLR